MASNASRYFFLLMVGLVIGAVLTVVALRAIQSRQDPFPGSVMHVMSKHAGLLKQNVEKNRCSTTDALPHLQALRIMGNDLELAFPSLADDQRFAQHASDYRRTLDAALQAPPEDCAAAGATLGDVGGACKACHQDFKG